jgi:hypothetical protein
MLRNPTVRRFMLVLLALGCFAFVGIGLAMRDRPAEEVAINLPLLDLGAPRDPQPGDPPRESHPLDPALEIARDRLAYIREHLADYECFITSRERIGDRVTEPQTMFARIRNRKVQDAEIITPLSVYLRFEQPAAIRGQQVLWVEGKNDNKLIARQGGALGRFMPSVWLDPKGALAMRGSRYPISEIGIENLVVQLIERGERDRKNDAEREVQVRFIEEAEVDGRPCTLIEVVNPVERPHLDFHIARIYIDQEWNLPVRYSAYLWPPPGTTEPLLLEEYTYTELKLNVGLTDADFDENNKKYGFR